ncbi:MAG: glycogen debranching protein GlgX [Maritimibacter sp.]
MTTPRPSLNPDRVDNLVLTRGQAWPMGAHVDETGVNFAVFSANATKIEICLFSDDGRTELTRIPLPERDGDIWHGHIAGIGAGTRYGLRAHGPYDPDAGHRFNPNKLLIDPYARKIEGKIRWSRALMGYHVGSPMGDLSFSTRDSAFAVPKCVVMGKDDFDWQGDAPLDHTGPELLIYEAHVKGLTAMHSEVDPSLRGTYLGITSKPVLEHLKSLGVTALELMPVHAFIDDRFLAERGLRNYWGYQTLGYFAPESRYLRAGQLTEFKTMVRELHKEGIEVILDVVYNHNAEGDGFGPTLSLRGLDNASYFRLAPNKRHYINDCGTGNALDLSHPAVLRMVMDSLRYWVEEFHVDGFRFDLAAALTRGGNGFDSGFLDAVRQDPVLARVKLIAEPWDVGPGGYRVGAFPHPFREWNDRYRDDVRAFWRGDEHMLPGLAKAILGSPEIFDKDGRSATASINMLTSHDGFTLNDLVSYNEKHNQANGEGNRDGHTTNFSDNLGTEGPTEDPVVLAARGRRQRAMLATLFFSQGIPMLLAGDEIGNTQSGNNNSYAQDNETGWIDWKQPDTELLDFTKRLSALRRRFKVLSQRNFLHGKTRGSDDLPDLDWWHPAGRPPVDSDWNDQMKTMGVIVRASSETIRDSGEPEVFIVYNAGAAHEVILPPGNWVRLLDSANPNGSEKPVKKSYKAAEQSVVLFAHPDVVDQDQKDS